MKKVTFDVTKVESSARSLFLDSGAFSFFHQLAERLVQLRDGTTRRDINYGVYHGKKFRRYLHEYAQFIKANADVIEYYPNVDVIMHPELSLRNQIILEEEYGLKPIPVLHAGTPLRYLEKYLERGCTFIGLGGFGSKIVTKETFMPWVHKVFDMIAPGPSRLPQVKVHGFAMTGWQMLCRFPWFSVDSASWIKAAAFGGIYVPHRRKGEFVFPNSTHFDERDGPYVLAFSSKSQSRSKKNGHFEYFMDGKNPDVERVLLAWLEQIKVPLGKLDDAGNEVERGVRTHHKPRARANLLYFETLCEHLPPWPSPYVPPKTRRGVFFTHEDWSKLP